MHHMKYKLVNFCFLKTSSSSLKQVQHNVAAATELTKGDKDEETLAEVEYILKPVKNQTWPSGI